MPHGATMFGFKIINSKTLRNLGVQNKDRIVMAALKTYGVETKAKKGIVLNSTFGKLLAASKVVGVSSPLLAVAK